MPWYSNPPGASIFTRQIDFKPLWRAARDHPAKVILVAGISLRLLVYGYGRPYWIDEGSLAFNVVGKPPLDFSAPLRQDQLAPIGFFVVERALVSIAGSSQYVTRLLALLCGILALVAFAKLAGRILPPTAALVALALFAFSDDLIYYSSELKPYSTDLAVGLAITLLAYDALTTAVTVRSATLIALVAFLAPWCSFASAFVVAGCGLAQVICARSLRRALVWVAIGAVWLQSFIVAYYTSHALLSPYTTMYLFWDFAFLPLWPLPPDRENLARSGGVVLEILVNPLNLVPPIPRWLGIMLPVLLLLAGCVRLFRRSLAVWLLLVLPFALAVVAACLKRYPLHGRLMLELVPAFFLLIALGTEFVLELDHSRRKLVYKATLVLLLAYPCFSSIYEATAARPRFFNSHGDLHNNVFLHEQINLPPGTVKKWE
jgi:hypothetical protein